MRSAPVASLCSGITRAVRRVTTAAIGAPNVAPPLPPSQLPKKHQRKGFPRGKLVAPRSIYGFPRGELVVPRTAWAFPRGKLVIPRTVQGFPRGFYPSHHCPWVFLLLSSPVLAVYLVRLHFLSKAGFLCNFSVKTIGVVSAALCRWFTVFCCPAVIAMRWMD